MSDFRFEILIFDINYILLSSIAVCVLSQIFVFVLISRKLLEFIIQEDGILIDHCIDYNIIRSTIWLFYELFYTKKSLKEKEIAFLI